MDAATHLGACATHPVDWALRFGGGLWFIFLALGEWDSRRTRPEPAVVRALADEAERHHGAQAFMIAHKELQALRAARDAQRFRLARAVADELLRRRVEPSTRSR